MIGHRWFGSGSYTLLGHVYSPADGASPLGVVIVPPFGWEDVCSYRPLRKLAGILAANGITVLRYDLPGTGDSSGDANSEGLFEAWIASVDDAARELRQTANVNQVAVIGIRMGALLTLAAAARGANIQDLVLWGGAAQGRTLLRELRAFRNLEVPEYANLETQPLIDEAGLEVGGFNLSQSTMNCIEALDLSALPPMQRRVLTLSRDEFAVDKKLTAALIASGASVEQQPGNGYGDLMTVPHEARTPIQTSEVIADWLKRNAIGEPAPVHGDSTPSRVDPTIQEEIINLPRAAGSSFGIVAPAPDTDLWLLLLNPGAGRHIGPNRLWVDLAREWQARGVPSLRIDLSGIGESDGEQNLDVAGLYNEALVDQVEQAMAFLKEQHGARRFILVGLCSGAFWAFHAAARNRAVSAAILVNPRLFFWDPEVDRRREKLRNVNAVASAGAWKRLVRGEVPAERIRNAVRDVFSIAVSDTSAKEPAQIPAQAFTEALARVATNHSRLTMIFTEGEPLLREMEDEGFLRPDTPFRCLRIANAGHTFRPIWAQAELRRMIGAEIEATLASRKD